MEESVTYQAILHRGLEQGIQQGSAAEAVKLLLRQGHKKFRCPPSADQETSLKAVTDVARLEALCEKLLDVNTWDELLAGA